MDYLLRAVSFLLFIVLVSGCAGTNSRQASIQSEYDACKKSVQQNPNHAVAKALVAYEGMPSPTQLANQSYPSDRHLKLIGDYWNALSGCYGSYTQKITSQEVGLYPQETLAVQMFFNSLNQLYANFLSGSMTYGQYYQNNVRLAQMVEQKKVEFAQMRAEERARAFKAFSDGFNEGTKNYKPVTIPSVQSPSVNCTSTDYGGIVKTTCN